MRLLKSNPLLSLVNSYIVDSPQPVNLSYVWNFGSLLALCLGIQIATGVILAMHYTPNVDLAFISVEHIMRDVNYGWMIRYIHANVASFFFIFVYLHIGRGLYYGSYKSPRVLLWSIGVIILVLMMGVAFLGYVLPYGQMSLWGATVITNMLSAIPWIGQDFVQFVWGGLYIDEPYNSDIVLQILLIAGRSSLRGFVYFKKYNLRVKMSKPRGKSAEVINLDLVSKDLASQRLDAENLFPYLVGLIEGDGWFTVSKNGMYLTYEIGIELNIRDIQLLYKIKKWLKVGIVGIKGKNELSDKAYFRIRNKSHLVNIILPIFDKYPILSNKQYDYLRVRSELLANTIYSKDLKEYQRPTKHINSVNTVLNTPYFKSWLIGFIEAEGCFSIYKPTNDTSKVASFDIAQTDDSHLITGIGVFLSFSQKPYKDKTNCFKLKVSNVRSVENIIKFIQSAPIKLQGYKRLSYLIWIKELRNIPRYSTRFKIPSKY